MSKKLNEYHFLIFLLEKREEGSSNYFQFDKSFYQDIKEKYKNITFEELEKIISKSKAYDWIKQKGVGCKFPPFELTEKGKGVAISKRLEYNENFFKKINKFIGEYRNIFYFIGFCVALALAYMKIKGLS